MISEKIKRKRVRYFGVIIGSLLILGLLVMPVLLPWIMGILVDAQHIYVDKVPEENRGAYLLTDKGVMQLYNWEIPLAELPSDTPEIEVGSFHSFSIVMKQLESAEAYHLFDLKTGNLINWQHSWHEGKQLRLDPGSLSKGDYMLVIPTDDLFGEKTYHYFRLR